MTHSFEQHVLSSQEAYKSFQSSAINSYHAELFKKLLKYINPLRAKIFWGNINI